jgi:hypothetical protein
MAAGLGFKTFTTGEVLTAADTNGYLMQGVLVFASAAARNAAITSPQEGQFAYTKDTNGLWYYDGAAWVASGATGDIEGVTAGVGISGGGTSGTVTITNDMATTITASGDIVVGTGAGTYDNLPIGTTGQILTADTTVSPYKVKWATPAGGGGKVLQVVYASTNTGANSASATLADTNLTATITPTLATSKILVMYSQNGCGKSIGSAVARMTIALLRGATVLQYNTDISCFTNTSTSLNVGTGASATYLDSPATTSATTYKTQFLSEGAIATVFCQDTYASTYKSASTITLMEIGV